MTLLVHQTRRPTIAEDVAPPGPVPWLRPAAFRLAGATAAASVAAALATYVDGGALGGPAVMQGSARGTALVVLVVAVPVLLLAVRAVAHGSERALPVWLGAGGYLLYNAVMFLFATPFNRWFLLYVAMFGLALWSTVWTLAEVDVGVVRTYWSSELPARRLAAYVWVTVGLNALAWLGTIVPALDDAEPAAVLEGSGLTTNPVHVQDLAVWLPIAAVGAWWLWQRRPRGVLVVGAVLVLWVLESLSIAADQWFGHRADPASSWADDALVPVFAGLALVGLVPVVVLLRHLHRPVEEHL